jgi:[ribosomal protein S18]-alanine N-acetyltransferase
VIIRAAKPGDLESLIDLERASPTAAHWSEQQYALLFQAAKNAPERIVLVTRAAEQSSHELTADSNLLGFLVARHVASEWELENIVVASRSRRKGVGKALLQAFLDQVKGAGGASVFLEVRESNAAARALYESAGFHQTGRRKSYYANPAEDAVLYRLDFRR